MSPAPNPPATALNTITGTGSTTTTTTANSSPHSITGTGSNLQLQLQLQQTAAHIQLLALALQETAFLHHRHPSEAFHSYNIHLHLIHSSHTLLNFITALSLTSPMYPRPHLSTDMSTCHGIERGPDLEETPLTIEQGLCWIRT